MAKGKKTGGRTAGTPNKDKPLKEVLRAHSTKYYTEPVEGFDGMTQFEIDLYNLAPDDRVAAEAKLLNKTVPDLKAVDANINSHNVTLTIEDRLRELCDEDDE